jgi:hypothetical protein
MGGKKDKKKKQQGGNASTGAQAQEEEAMDDPTENTPIEKALTPEIVDAEKVSIDSPTKDTTDVNPKVEVEETSPTEQASNPEHLLVELLVASHDVLDGFCQLNKGKLVIMKAKWFKGLKSRRI